MLTVGGYKSIATPTSVELAPFTILAGANSSGKSSIMQPLLLLKQTLEAGYDPGPLRLDGPNVRFTDARQQLFHHSRQPVQAPVFETSVGLQMGLEVRLRFRPGKESALDIAEMEVCYPDGASMVLTPDMTSDAVEAAIPNDLRHLYEPFIRQEGWPGWTVFRSRSFLEIRPKGSERGASVFWPSISLSDAVASAVRNIIHVPGLRGNPLRTYPVTSVGPLFPGTFERYVASLISHWQQRKDTSRLTAIGKDLQTLGLSWKVRAKAVSDTEVELQVGRLLRAAQGGALDLVSIADVGFGVSQTLPVLVAIRAAEPGQLIYLEQPEIHLHPRAQYDMALVLADAVKRGVRLVVETHSSLILLSIQTMVAKGKLDPKLVRLHWFRRSNDGVTNVESARLDKAGAFGDWPEDFGRVILEAESDYLSAAQLKLA